MPFFIAYFRSVGCSWALMIFLLLVLIGETVFNLWNVSTIRDKHFFRKHGANAYYGQK